MFDKFGIVVLQRNLTALLLACALAISLEAGPDWVVSTDGIGPAKVGMSLPELSAVLVEKFHAPPRTEDSGCFYVKPHGHPHVALMIEDGRLARIDVDGAGIPTREGIQIGDSEARALQAYGAKLKVEPSKYGGPKDHYLTYQAPDHRQGIRFETSKGKITIFYAGRAEAIQYVEGCD